MQDEVRLAGLLQRRAKCGDQLVRQIPYEADSIGQHDLRAVRQLEAANSRVQGRKKLVLDVHAGIGQRIEQGRLAGIRVADKRNGRHFGTHAVLPVHRAARVDVLEARVQLPDPAPEEAAIRFQLGLTGTAQADAAFLPLEVSPAAHQPGRQVPELRQFDLQLTLEAARTLRKDVENEARAVQDAAFEFAFQVAFLAGRERRPENDEFGAVGLDARSQLFYLALADEEPRLRPFAGADDLVDDDRSGRTRELRKLGTFRVIRCAVWARVDENCTFAALRSFKQIRPPATRVAFCS